MLSPAAELGAKRPRCRSAEDGEHDTEQGQVDEESDGCLFQ